jgi:hypothetical protein
MNSAAYRSVAVVREWPCKQWMLLGYGSNRFLIRNNGVTSEAIQRGAATIRGESRVEAGSNTSTVTLRVVGGDEKGSLESETVKYDHESHGTRTRELLHWRGPSAIVNDRHVLSS